MEEKDDILKLILGIEPAHNRRKSTLQLAITQARILVGIKPGEKASRNKWKCRYLTENDELSKIVDNFFKGSQDEAMNILTALSLYLIVLDQLGHIFASNTNKSNRTGLAIKLCKSISTHELSDKDINSIEHLRNSINHNFGLAAVNNTKNIGIEKFSIIIDDNGNHKPFNNEIQWDGNWHDKTTETSTQIYPFSLINLIEDTLQYFVILYINHNIKSPLSTEELKTRFTIVDG